MFPKTIFQRDLSLRLLAYYLVFVGIVVLAAFGFENLANRRLENDVKLADVALARAVAQETNTFIANALQAIEAIADYPAVIEADIPAMEPLFNALASARPDVNLVYRLNAEGIMLYHYPAGVESTVGIDFSFRDYFQIALNVTGPVVSLGRISPTTNQPVATAVMPLRDADGNFLGVVATNIKLQFLSNALASITAESQVTSGFQIFIVDSSGQVIAHPNADQLLQDANVTMPQVVSAVLNGESGNLIAGEKPEEMLISYEPVDSVRWGVIVTRPTATAFATSRAFGQGAVIAVAIFLLGGFFFWIALSRNVITPLERLASYSQSIGQEQLGMKWQTEVIASLSKRPDQVGNLTRSLTWMQQAIEARLNELSTLLQTSAAVVSTLDSQVVLERILEQVEHLMGLHMCTILALDENQGIFRVKASRGLSKRYTEQVNIDPSEPQSITLRAIHSGHPIQISDTEENPTYASLRPRARAEGYRAILAVPLNAQHAPPSALLVYYPEPHLFTHQEISLLSNFANHAAMAIENAALFARSDMQLQEQTGRLEALVESMQDGLILEDLNGNILYANRRILELTGFKPEELTLLRGTQALDKILSQAKDEEKTRQAVETMLNAGGQIRRVEMVVVYPDRVLDIRLQVFEVTDSLNLRIGRGLILQDISRSRQLDRMKSSLISTVSHELRTPLAAIKGYASTLLAEDVKWDLDSQREFLEIISAEADNLNELVNDLLDMSRIEAGNLSVSRVACELAELVTLAAHRSDPPPGERLRVSIPVDLPALYVDPRRITTVLRNLIENAARYTPEHSSIRLTAAPENGEL
ncbi:MAG TPA: cache domain-containing protein, partial [Anaerolineales bacterium]|nr:cache domain-containing protein [Anaerolineales bacterium]